MTPPCSAGSTEYLSVVTGWHLDGPKGIILARGTPGERGTGNAAAFGVRAVSPGDGICQDERAGV